MMHMRLPTFLACLSTLSTSSLYCPYVKRCIEAPISPTDKVGIDACFVHPLSVDCLTTATEPFYTCHCACDRCASAPLESCEAACSPSTTSSGMTTTPLARRARLFAIGGLNNVTILRSVDIFDFETSSWTKAPDLPEPLFIFAAASLNGKIYVVGGRTHSLKASPWTYVYDSTQNTWSIGKKMTTPREGHGVAELAGEIYAVSGWNEGAILRSAESFNPQTKTWNEIDGMSDKRGRTAAAVLDGLLYATGGNGKKSVEAYNQTTNRWSVVTPMNTYRSEHCAASVGNTLYAIGGTSDGYPGYPLRSVEAYTAKSNTWSFVADMSKGRSGCGAVSFNGFLYVLGGYSGVFLDTMEEYNPKTNTWRLLPVRMPTKREYFAATLLVE